MRYFKGTKAYIENLDSLISANLNLNYPTNNWMNARELEGGEFAGEIPVNGWNGFTYEQAMAGIDEPEYEDVIFKVIEEV